MLHSVIGTFNVFNQNRAIYYSDLYEKVADSGSVIFGLILTLAAMAAICAVVVLGINWMFRGRNVEERAEIKKMTVRVAIVIFLLGGVVSIIVATEKLGFDPAYGNRFYSAETSK